MIDDVTAYPNYVETMAGAQSEICVSDQAQGTARGDPQSREHAPRGVPRAAHAAADDRRADRGRHRQRAPVRRAPAARAAHGDDERGLAHGAAAGERAACSPTSRRTSTGGSTSGRGGIVVADEIGLAAPGLRAAAPLGQSPAHWPVDAGIVGRAIRADGPVLALDVTTDPDYVALTAETLAEFVVPLCFRGADGGAR